jgi:hypothetical protein
MYKWERTQVRKVEEQKLLKARAEVDAARPPPEPEQPPPVPVRRSSTSSSACESSHPLCPFAQGG